MKQPPLIAFEKGKDTDKLEHEMITTYKHSLLDVTLKASIRQ